MCAGQCTRCYNNLPKEQKVSMLKSPTAHSSLAAHSQLVFLLSAQDREIEQDVSQVTLGGSDTSWLFG